VRRTAMPKIKHIVLSAQDVEKTAKFYVERSTILGPAGCS
jgi:hypothetical protein